MYQDSHLFSIAKPIYRRILVFIEANTEQTFHRIAE